MTVRKLIESTLISLDGVIESPERWAIFDEEAAQLSMRDLDNYDAFIMGRVTYERLRAQWAPVTGNPYIEKINAMPKYVASQSLGEVTWNATLLEPDIVAAIERLKSGTREGPHQIRHQPPRRDAPARSPRRRAASVDHASRRRQRPALVRGHRHLLAEAQACRRAQARKRLGHPHVHIELKGARYPHC
jgi:hypothetical protein